MNKTRIRNVPRAACPRLEPIESVQIPEDSSRAANVSAGFRYMFDSVDDHVAALVADPLGQLERDLIDCGLAPVLATATLIYYSDTE